MKKLSPLLAALILAAAFVTGYTAPEVMTWGQTAATVYPAQGSGVTADTLTRQLSAGDSIATTDEIGVFGARAIYLVVRSDGSDSMTVPVLQLKTLDGQWTGAGGAGFAPPTGGAFSIPFTATTTITSTTRFIWCYYNEFSSGGTPVPFPMAAARWRIKSSDARRYNTASSATLASTGRYTLTAIVWR